MIKDPGKKQVASTGASRSCARGRGKPSLLPFDALMELAKHFEEGAKTYAPRNWEKGLPLSWFLDSHFRHLTSVMMGETDESHATAMTWNMVCFLATWLRIENGTLPAELDDLPHHVASKSITDKQFTPGEIIEHLTSEAACSRAPVSVTGNTAIKLPDTKDWKGDDTKTATVRKLCNGDDVFSHGGKFVARMDTTGMVREMLMGDYGRRHVVDFVCVSDYVKSLK